jgi:DNA-binding beta-propeller fold protein YncE
MVAPGGTISTVAGNGTAGYSPDGTLATEAELNYPFDVAWDAKTGNLYIVDQNNQCVRMVAAIDGQISANSTIWTVAGTCGKAGYSGDHHLATEALLNGPDGVTTDSEGNLYIAEYNNNTVRQVTPNGNPGCVTPFLHTVPA